MDTGKIAQAAILAGAAIVVLGFVAGKSTLVRAGALTAAMYFGAPLAAQVAASIR